MITTGILAYRMPAKTGEDFKAVDSRD